MSGKHLHKNQILAYTPQSSTSLPLIKIIIAKGNNTMKKGLIKKQRLQNQLKNTFSNINGGYMFIHKTTYLWLLLSALIMFGCSENPANI